MRVYKQAALALSTFLMEPNESWPIQSLAQLGEIIGGLRKASIEKKKVTVFFFEKLFNDGSISLEQQMRNDVHVVEGEYHQSKNERINSEIKLNIT